jgi:hypothetical protein
MRRALPPLIVLCLGFAPAPVYRGKPDASKGVLERMQGEWALVRQTLNGKDLSPRVNKSTLEIAVEQVLKPRPGMDRLP